MNDIADIEAVVLAGGLGTRLRSAVPDRPKVLALVRGRPFLAHVLDRLEAAGVRRVVLGTGYGADRVREAIGDRHGRTAIAYSHETSPLGTGGAVRLAAGAAASDPVLVLNGDSHCEADLAAFAAFHRTCGAAGSLMLTRVPDTGRYGRVDLDDVGRVTAFREKGDAAGPGWINAGIYLLSREMLDAVPEGRAVSLEREVFPLWAGRGRLFGLCGGGRFLDIGTPESYREAEEFFAAS
jgi:NDP-sugar pyrophosphorylase family protein